MLVPIEVGHRQVGWPKECRCPVLVQERMRVRERARVRSLMQTLSCEARSGTGVVRTPGEDSTPIVRGFAKIPVHKRYVSTIGQDLVHRLHRQARFQTIPGADTDPADLWRSKRGQAPY